MRDKFFLIMFIGMVSGLLSVPAIAAKSGYSSPLTVDGTKTISVTEAKSLYDQGLKFIDVRNPRLYARAHIPGAIHLDLKHDFDEARLKDVAEVDEPIIIYCSGVKCSRSYRASASAVSWGFEAVHYFRGGIVEWKKAGYPVETASKDKSNPVTGSVTEKIVVESVDEY